MRAFFRRRIHKSVADGDIIDVSEQDGIRSLHLGSDTVQSSMRINAPYELELSYTRSMMAFLLFHPEPRRVLMVGLGGGSVTKFIHHHIPAAHTTVVEINPRVVAIARSLFFVPEDDQRLLVEVGDGVEYVASHPGAADVLMLDGYDCNCQVESLATQSFYDACANALTEDGVLVVNLWGSDYQFDSYLRRIETSFDGLTLCLPAEKRGNIIVLAFRKSPGNPRWDALRQRARELEAQYGLEFLRFVEGLKTMNLHSEKRLLI
jgi:spermidine synthase